MTRLQAASLPAKDVALVGDEGLGDAIANARGHASDHNHSVYVDDDSQAGPSILIELGPLPASQQPALLLLRGCRRGARSQTSLCPRYQGLRGHVRDTGMSKNTDHDCHSNPLTTRRAVALHFLHIGQQRCTADDQCDTCHSS